MWGMVRDGLESMKRADMDYCMCHSKELVLFNPREDFELQKTYLSTRIFIFIDVSRCDIENKLEVTRLLAGRLFTKLFVQDSKGETLN